MKEKFNHNRSLSDFKDQLKKIKDAGFNPIAVTQIYFEDTFVFETGEEAEKAYNLFECNKEEDWIGDIVGWWYGKDDFKELIDEYEKESNSTKVKIYWL